MDRVLERFDAVAVRRRFEEAGVFCALQQKGFAEFEVTVESAGWALPHVKCFAHKGGVRVQLLDACIGEAVVRPDFFDRCGYSMERPIELAVVHWVREEDPTARFTPDRPPLPLQVHPGLGILRHTFRVIARLAGEVGKDGVVSVPKFFHDAVIFFRSRLFLFLDGHEQGRFEALMRDLRDCPLGHASLALASGCVHDAEGTVASWRPGYLVFPVSDLLAAYFHSPRYAALVATNLRRSSFTLDIAAARRARALLRAADADADAPGCTRKSDHEPRR